MVEKSEEIRESVDQVSKMFIFENFYKERFQLEKLCDQICLLPHYTIIENKP